MQKMVQQFNADAVERLEAELAKLNAQGAVALNEIDCLAAHEGELENSDELLAAMAATRAARNRLKKLEGKIADVRERLGIAKDAVRAKLRADLLAIVEPLGPEFLAAARATQEVLRRYIAAREALRSAGFERDFQSLPIPPHINGSALTAPEMLSIFEDSLNPGKRKSAAVLQRPSAKIVSAPPTRSASTSIRVKKPPRRETAAEGERLFFVFSGFLDHPTKGRIKSGDVISLPLDEGRRLIRNRVGDWTTSEEVAQIDANGSNNSAAPSEKPSA